MTIITVVIALGPANNGIAIGNTETSSLLVASFISYAVTLSRETLACNISNATIKSNIPPATIKQSTVTPGNLRINSPDIAKTVAKIHATVTERFAISFLSVVLIPMLTR